MEATRSRSESNPTQSDFDVNVHARNPAEDEASFAGDRLKPSFPEENGSRKPSDGDGVAPTDCERVFVVGAASDPTKKMPAAPRSEEMAQSASESSAGEYRPDSASDSFYSLPSSAKEMSQTIDRGDVAVQPNEVAPLSDDPRRWETRSPASPVVQETTTTTTTARFDDEEETATADSDIEEIFMDGSDASDGADDKENHVGEGMTLSTTNDGDASSRVFELDSPTLLSNLKSIIREPVSLDRISDLLDFGRSKSHSKSRREGKRRADAAATADVRKRKPNDVLLDDLQVSETDTDITTGSIFK